MKKSSLFVSAAITTFILAVIAGVIKAKADGMWSTTSASTPTTGLSVIVPTDTQVVPTDTSSSAISPQEATFIAGSVLGSSDFYSIDTVSLYGMDVFKVTFSSGNIVYVSPEGHVLLVTYLRRYTTSQPSGSQQSSGQQSQGQGQQSPQVSSPTNSSPHSDGGGSDDSGGDH